MSVTLTTVLLAVVAGYILGSIPFGPILTKVFLKQDVRTTGSHNIGATNVFRLNRKLGIATFVLDAGKGLLAVVLAGLLLGGYKGNQHLLVYLAAIFVVVGHMFPVWLRFRGGKGVSTSIGAVLGFVPLLALAMVIVWGVALSILRKPFIASILMVIVAFIFTVFFASKGTEILLFVFVLLSLWAHRQNILQIFSRNEDH